MLRQRCVRDGVHHGSCGLRRITQGAHREPAPSTRRSASLFLLTVGVAACGSDAEQKPATTEVMTETTEAMMTDTTDAMMTDTTDAMMTDTTGG